MKVLKIRAKVESSIRKFFLDQDFLEVRTPLLVPSPGMEIHIKPMRVTGVLGEHQGYLHTSPEFGMKKLLSQGFEKIFQMTPCFRDEPKSSTHHPEFLMLEWYRAQSDLDSIIRDTENLVSFIAEEVHERQVVTYQGADIDFSPPWPRFSVDDLFLEFAGVKLGHCTDDQESRTILIEACKKNGIQVSPTSAEAWDDLFFLIWLNLIEPKLPKERPCFVFNYPPSMAALSKLNRIKGPSGESLTRASRFEFFAGGFELGNAFHELTDAKEQRRRFQTDMERRRKIYGPAFPPSPIDESFMEALEKGIHDPSGIAVGVDRIVMLMSDAVDIKETLWIS